MKNINALLEPGMLVRHPGQPDWGIGQVQSNIGGKITVTAVHAKTEFFAVAKKLATLDGLGLQHAGARRFE